MTLLVLLVVGAGWYGYRELVSPPDAPVEAAPGCTDGAADGRLRAGEVTVNIYNSGDISGLAGTTLAALQRRGFVPGASENAPARIAARTAVIYGSAPTSAEARLVQLQFTDEVRVVRRPNLAEGVDVVLGSRFGGIDRTARRSVSLPTRESRCEAAAS